MFLEEITTLHTDASGNRYYTASEAQKELGVSRSTFDKRVQEEKIKRYRRANDTRFYYRVEDIDRLKKLAAEFTPEGDGNKELAAVAS